ncbi:MAG TPA: VCBS repeat-containing protein [Bryobacteraceae bacterium]|nr:VCBS repeat-containing protein [Bryobacteraceae bacterium]
MSERKIPKRKQNIPVVIAVLAVVGILAGFSRLPSADPGEVSRLAAHFKFEWQYLPPAPVPEGGVVFPVNKSAKQLRYYLNMVGASAAFGDLDGDGLPNDLCATDVRAKSITVAPAPGTGNRYPRFSLEFGPAFDRVTEYPSLCRIADMNEDGLADIFVAFWGRPPMLLLRRAPEDLKPGAPLSMASFKVVELVPGLSERWWSSTATFADIDGDGHQDIVMGNYFADGNELTDANSDKPVEMNEDFTRARNGGKSRIFLYAGSKSGADPSVVYKEVANPFPGDGAHAWTLAVGAADLDRDGLSDLYIANDFGPDELLWNHSTPGHVQLQLLKGEKGFNIPESMVVGEDSFKGMSSDFGDINGDGIFDMFISNISSPFAMSESHFLWVSTGTDQMAKMSKGIAPWVDRGDQLGVSHSSWAWDTRFEDMDNDGVLELLQATGFVKGNVNKWADFGQFGTSNDMLVKNPANWPRFDRGSDLDGHSPSPFYALGSRGRYVNLATSVLPGLTPAGRGIAVGDVDGDGYPEFVYANIWEDSAYVKNKGSGNKFLGLHLLLPLADAGKSEGMKIHDGHPGWREGTPAIGTFVEADVPGGQKQIRQVDGGNGHSGQRSPEIRIGLGQTAASEIPVKITWRDFQGAVHHDALALAPGYHTVVLGSAASTKEEKQ